MKKILFTILPLVFMCCGFSYAYNPNGSMDIILRPGRNVASTPAKLSSLSFSGGTNLNAYYMSNSKWIPTTLSNTSLMEPLEGYLIRNNSNQNITMTLGFKPYDGNPMDYLLSKNIYGGRNFLGITTTQSPFSNITNAQGTTILDFTHVGNYKYTNRIPFVPTETNGTNFTIPNEYEIGEAYAVFMNNDGIYGGYNNIQSNENGYNEEYCNDVVVKVTCAAEAVSETYVDCPIECLGAEFVVRKPRVINPTIVYGAKNVIIGSGKIEINEPIYFSFSVKARETTDGITDMYFVYGDREYKGEKIVQGVDTIFYFNNIIAAETSDFSIKVDINDDSGLLGRVLKFVSSDSENSIIDMRFLDNNELIEDDKKYGKLPIGEITIQYPEVSGTNNGNVNGVEFYVGENNTKSVGSISYYANKGDVYLTSIYLSGQNFNDTNVVRLDLYVGGQTILDVKLGENHKILLPDIKVLSGKSVGIGLYATIDGYENHIYDDLKIYIDAKDVAGHSMRQLSFDIYPIKVIKKEITLGSTETYNTILLEGRNTNIFTFYPQSNVQGDSLKELTMTFPESTLGYDDIMLKSKEYPYKTIQPSLISENGITFTPNTNISVGYDVVLKGRYDGNGVIRIKSLNNEPKNYLFTSNIIYVDPYLYIEQQRQVISNNGNDGYTSYTVGVNKNDSESVVKNLEFWNGNNLIYSSVNGENIEHGDSFQILGGSSPIMIDKIRYTTVKNGIERQVEFLKSDGYDRFIDISSKIGTYSTSCERPLQVFPAS